MIKKTFQISTAIDYPSEKPHLGHCLEKVQADVIARYKRFQGLDVHFSIGTDEHGLKIQRYAEKARKEPQEFVEKTSGYFKDLWRKLNISNNDFIRTTENRHIKVVQQIIKKIYEKGDIYKGKYKGLYCVDCETYYLPKDLIDGNCPIHHKAAELIEEETYFFKMSKYQSNLIEHIKNNKNFIIPESKKNEVLNRLKEPLQDLSISRKTVKWGIPLPIDKKLTLFVWVDALINYLTTIDYPNDKFKKYWPADIHVIGKDIVWHHVVIWSTLLLSLGLPLPKTIFIHGFITSNGQKMSKSLGNVVDPFELVEKYGADPVRYFLLREIPPTEDGDYTREKFEERYNSDLVNGIGNTIRRVLTLVDEKCGGVIPQWDQISYSKKDIIDKFFNKINIEAIKDNFETFYFNLVLEQIIIGFQEIDKDIEEKKPWTFPVNDPACSIFYVWLELIRIFAHLSSSLLPQTANEIFKQLGLDPEEEKRKIFEEATQWGRGGLKAKTKIKKGEHLFPRI